MGLARGACKLQTERTRENPRSVTSRKIQTRLLVISGLLYTASLALPAFSYELPEGGRESVRGLTCLFLSVFFGWAGYLCCWANFSFLLWFSITARTLRRSSNNVSAIWRLVMGLPSPLFAASFLLVDRFPLDEAGIRWGEDLRLSWGFWLWMGAMLVALFDGISVNLMEPPSKGEQ